MANAPQNTFDIPQGGYAAFDAMSLRQLILSRLNDQGIFTDQNYVGSNLASIIDIVAFSYNTLIYYLNKTSTESMFTEAQLYENVNRIVKLIDYSPVGFQASTLMFECSATSSLPAGTYTIPRYTAISTNNLAFTFAADTTFTKLANGLEYLQNLSDMVLLHQGTFIEAPAYTAVGDNNEVYTIPSANNEFVDHFNIDVYVQSAVDRIWRKYNRVTSLYLESGASLSYEVRFNGAQRYEIKFGNNINGARLNTGDVVTVFYLSNSDTSTSIPVGPGALSVGDSFYSRNTLSYNAIIQDTANSDLAYLTDTDLLALQVTNSKGAVPSSPAEGVDQIKNLAPATYKSQYRVVTNSDYSAYIGTNFSGFVQNLAVLNNWQYTSEYLNYYVNVLGLTSPEATGRAQFNQVRFADSCNFNSVYLAIVPKTYNIGTYAYLAPAQKELISTALQDVKMLTTEVAFLDPVYKAVGVGINATGDVVTDTNNTQLIITKSPRTRKNDQAIVNSVISAFQNFFLKDNLALGQTLNIRDLALNILSIDGVDSIQTANGSVVYDGLSLAIWNPLYATADYQFTTNNYPLRSFEYVYSYDLYQLVNKIVIQSIGYSSTVSY